MTPVDDMRWCPWCHAVKPADHDCIGDTETRGDPMTALIERPTSTLTPAAVKWLNNRLTATERDVDSITAERARCAAEVAAMDVILAGLQATADRYREILADAPPPLADSAGEYEELPVEAAAHAAVEGREHPYAPTQCGGA